MMKKIIQILMAILFAMPVLAQQTITLENVEAVPGPVAVNLDMNGFTNVGAITLYVSFDSEVLDFEVPPAVPFMGGTITVGKSGNIINMNWFNPAGANIDGTFFTLQFNYVGGFTSPLNFVGNCEIANSSGTIITGITYTNGSVSPDLTQVVGNLTIAKVFSPGADSIPLPDPPGGYLVIPDPVDVAVIADGLSAAAVGSIQLSIGFDSEKLTYTGFTANQFEGWVVSVDQASGTLTFTKTSASALSILDGDLITIHFDFLTGLAEVNFAPETSLHYINATPIPVGLEDGFVNSVTEVNLKLFLEGLYIGGGMMRKAQDHNGVAPFDKYPGTVADLITVELHDGSNYGTIVWSQNDVDLNTDGTALVLVPSMFTDQYYITIKNRNHLETVSATAILFGGSITYDFTDAANKAYGNNQKDLLDGNFAIFAGDVDQNGVINTFDRSVINVDIYNGSEGYLTTDVNGDGSVTTFDRAITNSNIYNGIEKLTP